jgi:hypothetical protein
MGASGAARLIKSAAAKPAASAAALFPHAARVNRSIFYDRGGAARSTAQVYAQLVSRHEKTRAPDGIAAIVAAMAQDGTAAVAPAARAQATAASVPVGASAPARAGYAGEEGPVFHGLFRTDSRAPVSEAVNRFWGPPLAATAASTADASGAAAATPAAARTAAVQGAAAADAAPPAGQPLNLFQFLHRSIRAGSGPA